MKNNFEKLFTVEEALHYDAAALLPGLDAAVVLGNLDESFAWSLTRTATMKLRRSGELGNPDNAKRRSEQRIQRIDTRMCR